MDAGAAPDAALGERPRTAHRPAGARSRAACAPAATCRCRAAGAALRPRPIVLLCDVSGSMERYSRMLLHFAHAMARRHRAGRGVPVFDPADAHHRAAARAPPRRGGRRRIAVVPDWSGGTRIGDALRQFHQRWGRRTLRGGPVVLLDLRRLGPRRSGGAARSDRAAAAQLPSADLAQPADRHDRLRAADARAARGAAVCGRLPAGADADRSRRPRATLERSRFSAHDFKKTQDSPWILLAPTPSGGKPARSRLDAADGPGGDFLMHPRL